MGSRKVKTVLAVVAVLLMLWAIGNVGAGPQADTSPGNDEVSVTGVTAVLLQYQGRLTDPGTGNAVSDGTYTMVFRLYTVPAGGSALWTEAKDVAVAGGLFSTVLGDTTPLTQSLFNGQELWLGVKVGTDEEATPRQRLLPVAYALSLVPGAVIEVNSSSSALQLTNLGSGEALRVNGQTTLTGNLAVSGSLSGGSHSHSGGDISSGTVAEVRIDAAIARDSEIVPTVLAGDGTGSTLDADLLDGLQATAFAATGHAHSGADITTGTVADARIASTIARDSEILPTVLAGDGAGSGLDADLVDGYQASSLFALNENETVTGIPAFNGGTSGSSAPFSVDSNYPVTNLNADLLDGYTATNFSLTSHDHDARYYTQATSDSRYVNASGDTMSGVLTVPRVAYSSPRTHYYSLGSEAFQPGSDVSYVNTYGNGGANIVSGSGALVAPVNLPHGAVVTEFRVFFDDTSTGDMTVSLEYQYLTGGGYYTMAQVTSSGTSGYYNLADTSISSATIDNTQVGYLIYAYSTAWSSTLMIKGVRITYTISEAP